MILAVIFDFDGTLANTLPLCYESFRGAVKELVGREPSNEEIEKCFGPDDLGVIRLLLPQHPELHEKGKELFLQHYVARHAELADKVYPGVKEVLQALIDKGIKIAMVTGKAKESTEISLKHYGLESYFSIIGTGSPDGGIKPQKIKEVLMEMGLLAREALYVGDALSDIDACKQVPIQIASVGWGEGVNLEALKAKKTDYILQRIEDLPMLVETLKWLN